jgi:hypothetical protein
MNDRAPGLEELKLVVNERTSALVGAEPEELFQDHVAKWEGIGTDELIRSAIRRASLEGQGRDEAQNERLAKAIGTLANFTRAREEARELHRLAHAVRRLHKVVDKVQGMIGVRQ